MSGNNRIAFAVKAAEPLVQNRWPLGWAIVDDECNYLKHRMFLKPNTITHEVNQAALESTNPIAAGVKCFYYHGVHEGQEDRRIHITKP